MKFKSIIKEIVTGLIILLFIYTAVSKLLTWNEFTIELGKSPLLKDFPIIVAILVIALETLTAFFLLISSYRLIGFYCSLFMMMLFTSYLVITINFSYYIPCTCGGVLSSLTWNQHIILNLAFIILIILSIYLYDNSYKKKLANQGKAENL